MPFWVGLRVLGLFVVVFWVCVCVVCLFVLGDGLRVWLGLGLSELGLGSAVATKPGVRSLSLSATPLRWLHSSHWVPFPFCLG